MSDQDLATMLNESGFTDRLTVLNLKELLYELYRPDIIFEEDELDEYKDAAHLLMEYYGMEGEDFTAD
jgi:hypothetical protein